MLFISKTERAKPDALQRPCWTGKAKTDKIRLLAELWCAKRACGAPRVSKSTHPGKFGNHVTVHCPPARPPARPPAARPSAARPSAPQCNQCSIPQFLASLGAQEDWYCTHIAHQCCDQLQLLKQGPADQYHLTVSRAQESTHRGWSYPLTSY